MPHPSRFTLQDLTVRLRARFGPRAMGIVLALLFEALLALLLLTLAPSMVGRKDEQPALITFSTAPEAEREAEDSEAAKQKETQSEQAHPEATPKPAPTPQPDTAEPKTAPEPKPTPPLILLAPDQMAASDIGAKPEAPKPAGPTAKPYGPQASPLADTTSGDTPRVSGSGPDGQPLYAAEWYREPSHAELSGFLSAAKGPGWGMIACKTAPRYRVQDCVTVDEYPEGSGIAHAVQLAAYQFKVIPPRIGGETQVGAWVRIRIDYSVKGDSAN